MHIYKRVTTRSLDWLDKDKEICDEKYERTYSLFGIFKWSIKFNHTNDVSKVPERRTIGLK